MARIVVMPDATHLQEGINSTILYAEHVTPGHLDDLRCSEEILERVEGAVRGEGPRYEHAVRAPEALRSTPPDHTSVSQHGVWRGSRGHRCGRSH